ncbi:hypothetical protein GCM10027570_54590 [Streptomonospora sediminis]
MDNGSTVVVIEPNLDVIARADWVIDMGPGPGRHGGAVVFAGTPAGLAAHPDSETARHLRRAAGQEQAGAAAGLCRVAAAIAAVCAASEAGRARAVRPLLRGRPVGGGSRMLG